MATLLVADVPVHGSSDWETTSLAINALKGVIEHIDSDAASRTFELVSFFQVYRSRHSDEIPDRGTPQFYDYMYDTALLQAYINSLYEYARNEEDVVDTSEPSRKDMSEGLKNAFTLMHMVQHEELYLDVRELIERRHKEAKAK